MPRQRQQLGFDSILAIYFLGSALAATGSAEIFAPRSQELRDGAFGGLAGVADFSDRLGMATAVGDFDGDGRDDVAASEFEGDALAFAGAVHVAYGGPDGPSTVDDQFWIDFDPSTLLTDREANDWFGWAIAAGDFDGDGYDDLAIGVPRESVSAVSDVGVVLVLYGTENGLALDSTVPPRRFQLGSGGIGGTPHSGDRFGGALATGDFSGDGFDDLAVGIAGMDSGLVSGGGVLVIYGSASGLQTSNELLLDQNVSGMPEDADTGDGFGAALAVGDFDADGNDDLAIGVPGESVSGSGCSSSSGAVHVLYGDLGAGLILVGNQLWHELNVDAGGDCGAGDEFGSTLAAGDLTADGAADLVVGAPREDLPGVVDAGAITFLVGGVGVGISTFASTLFDETDFAASANPQASDQFGWALAIGDFREDVIAGRLDLAIGIPGDNVWNGISSVVDAGSVILAHGGFGLGTAVATVWAPGLRGAAGALVANQEFGSALAAGDFDGDGHGDLAVGVPGSDVGQFNAGALFVLQGALFADGFGAGDLAAWSAVVP
jgi:hypothetical protein